MSFIPVWFLTCPLCLSFFPDWFYLQASGAETIRGQGEVLALQASLFQAQLELQAGQRAQCQAVRTQEDLNRALERLEKELQGSLEHKREAERHNQVRK